MKHFKRNLAWILALLLLTGGAGIVRAEEGTDSISEVGQEFRDAQEADPNENGEPLPILTEPNEGVSEIANPQEETEEIETEPALEEMLQESSATPLETLQAPVEMPRDAYYEIASELDETYNLDVEGASYANGANVQLYKQNGTSAQVFHLTPINDAGLYRFMNAGSGLALQVADDGKNVFQTIPSNNEAQFFELINLDGGKFIIRSILNGKVLTVAGGNPTNSANIQVEDGKTEENSQIWNIREVFYSLPQSGMYEIVSVINQAYGIDIAGAAYTNSTNAQLYRRNGTNAQKFYFSSLGGDRFKIICVHSGKSLDISHNQTADGTNIQQWRYDAVAAQTFRLIPREDGSYEIRGLSSNKCIDVKSGKANNKQNIHLWKKNGTAAQRWFLVGTTYQHNTLAKGKKTTDTSIGDYVTIVPKGNENLSVQPYKGELRAGIVLGKGRSDTLDDWIIRSLGNGKYEIVNVYTGFALDNKDRKTTDSNPMQLFRTNQTTGQSWAIVESGDQDGSFYLVNGQTGKYLDVRGGNIKAGTVIQQYRGNKSTAQRFYLRRGTVSNGWQRAEAQECLYKNGKIARVGFPYYCQKDYAHVPFHRIAGADRSVKTSGCGITSFAMVASYVLKRDVTPEDVAKLANSNNALYNTVISHRAHSNLASYYGISAPEQMAGRNSDGCVSNNPYNESRIREKLSKGYTIIASATGGMFNQSGSGHYYVVHGIAPNGAYVYDPNNRETDPGKYPNNGYTFNQIFSHVKHIWIFPPG